MKKYCRNDDGKVVELVSESPNGDFVMLQNEGQPDHRWIIHNDDFNRFYQNIEQDK
ncbi:hypothetical protein [Cohnella lupini]|uniref:Uncharacterized protein n=1 Tax=Cohnella lupini TaxID=1294267 RepID=A0A3D9HZH4_9BACL|nr:hypothetical protein [Cohnella lupini]RED54810.1 hypothetical protein DFP95_12166 [Cohnella lupini]